MRRHLILIEPTTSGFSAYSPDLPGCAATGETRDDVERNMREAVELHVEGLRELGEPVPPQHIGGVRGDRCLTLGATLSLPRVDGVS